MLTEYFVKLFTSESNKSLMREPDFFVMKTIRVETVEQGIQVRPIDLTLHGASVSVLCQLNSK